jgi:hypothetical protein
VSGMRSKTLRQRREHEAPFEPDDRDQRAVTAWHLPQRAAATRLGVTRPCLNDLLRGRVGKFSLDTLVALAAHAGLAVRICIPDRAGIDHFVAGRALAPIPEIGQAVPATRCTCSGRGNGFREAQPILRYCCCGIVLRRLLLKQRDNPKWIIRCLDC